MLRRQLVHNITLPSAILKRLRNGCAAIAQGYVAIDTETTSLHIMQAELVGVSLALAPGKAAYIPIGHVVETETGIAIAIFVV